jgi:hypothetical protein
MDDLFLLLLWLSFWATVFTVAALIERIFF